jgi:hypothetical protein
LSGGNTRLINSTIKGTLLIYFFNDTSTTEIYTIGHYVPVVTSDEGAARNFAICACEDGDAISEVKESIEDAFAEIEAEIDAIAEEGNFILNGPSDPAKGVQIAEQNDWGRPVVMEVTEEIAAASDGKDGN